MNNERTEPTEGQTYTLTLRSVPQNPGGVSEAQRLKGLLKIALRSFGFKCVNIEQI